MSRATEILDLLQAKRLGKKVGERKVFFSFDHQRDSRRANRVKRTEAVKVSNELASDERWKEIVRSGRKKTKKWIDEQMADCSCTVVLVGAKTANLPWINYEIEESWNRGMGIVGIRIHGLIGDDGRLNSRGENPFNYFKVNGHKLSKIVRCYNPLGLGPRFKIEWISRHLSKAVEEAIYIRNKYK